VSARIVEALPPNFNCVVRHGLGDPQRALLDYFVNLTTVRDDNPSSARCRALLVQTSPQKIPKVAPEWTEAWRGSRPGDRNELLLVYKR
jgi:hypothetical protein